MHQRLWRWDEASAAFQRAFVLSPNDTQIMSDYAWHAAFRGDYADAVRPGRRRVELTPGVAAAQIDLGIALAYAGDFDAALRSHRAAVAMTPRWTISRQHAGMLEARAGDAAAAQADFAALEAQFGDNAPVVFLPELAVGYALIGRKDDALEIAAARAANHEPDQGFFSLMHLKNNWFGLPLLEEPASSRCAHV